MPTLRKQKRRLRANQHEPLIGPREQGLLVLFASVQANTLPLEMKFFQSLGVIGCEVATRSAPEIGVIKQCKLIERRDEIVGQTWCF